MLQKSKAVLLAACLLAAFSCESARALAAEPSTQAQAAALVEMNTGKLLLAKNPHEKLPMASTTKVMTAILAIENCSLEEKVKVTKEAYGTEGSSMYLELGEELSMEDVLYGLMLSSGNDAAVAIAVHIAGSKEAFADMMNEKAQELGLSNTHFVTPNGLPDDAHYTTAYELALISAYAMQNETFRNIVCTRDYVTKTGNRKRKLHNKNKTLYLYEGGNGVKTGYTKAAGRCLCFSAQRGGMQLVGAVLHSGDTYGDAFSLMDYGFAQYEMQKLVSAGDVIHYARLQGAKKNILALEAQKDIIVPVKVGDEAQFRSQLRLDKAVEAPVEQGDVYGALLLWENGRLMASSPLIAAETVYENTIMDYFKRCIRDWSA